MRKCKICEKGNLVDEGFPYQEETQRAISIARKLGVWPEPLKLYRHLSKSGKGLVFRVPSDLEVKS